jgi:hypothetical protein
MLEWIKKDDTHSEHPMRDLASASALLANLRGSDPAAALVDLTGWAESLKSAVGFDPHVESEVLAMIQETGAPHVSALIKQYLADTEAKLVLREAKWKSLFDYASALMEALYRSADRLLAARAANGSVQAAGAVVHALIACRTLARVCLVHYTSVPASVWKHAYSIHAAAEAAGFGALAVHPSPSNKSTTTAAHELLRLLVFQMSLPEMMAPLQIEVAERAIQQVGSDFTLRPAGVCDNPFCFDPAGELPPRRADGEDPDLRYFGCGTGFDALARLHKQFASAGSAEFKAFGKDIAPHVQLAVLEHLLRFWGPEAYLPPVRSPVKGEVRVVHRYAQIWQHLPDVESVTKGAAALGIAPDHDALPEAPEVWCLRDAGGNEVGVEIPQLKGDWARCGELVGLSVDGGKRWWIGLIHRMHADLGENMRVEIAVLSRKPLAVALQGSRAASPQSDTAPTSGSFAFFAANAILLTDVAQSNGKSSLLLPPVAWSPGRIYDAMVGGPPRSLRVLQLLKKGEDYVRVAFEWLPLPRPS